MPTEENLDLTDFLTDNEENRPAKPLDRETGEAEIGGYSLLRLLFIT
jgi:hypothetical protein